MTDSVNIATLLQELTGQDVVPVKDHIYSCPLHTGKDRTLYVRHNTEVPGGWELQCTDIDCRFHGSIIELAAQTQDSSLGNAMRMFYPLGSMHGMFFEAGDPDMDREALQCCLVGRENQAAVKTWLEKAQRAFQSHNLARTYLVGRGIREDQFYKIHPAICCREMPENLYIQVKRMQLEQTIIYPYYAGGDVVMFVFEDMLTAKRRCVTVGLKQPIGAYMPQLLPVNATRLIVGQTETDAMVLFSKSEEDGTPDFYPVCVNEMQGLDAAFNATEVVLISHADRPLELKDTLKFCGYRLPVKVVTLPVTLIDIDSAVLASAVDEAKGLSEWHADYITKCFNENGAGTTIKMLNSVGLPKSEKSEIIEVLLKRKCFNEVLLDIIRRSELLHMVKTLGDVTVKRSAAGYFQLRPVEKQISNYMFQADNIVGKEKDMIVMGRVITPDFEQEMLLPAAVLGSPAKLNNYIWDGMVAAGRNFQPFAFQPAGGLTWRHLVTMFDEPACVSERTLLGISEDYISYPEARIRISDGKVDKVQVPDALKNRFCNMYGGILASTESCATVMRKLMASDDTAVVEFLELVGHVLFQTAAASLKSNRYQPDHLIVPFQFWDSGRCLTVSRLASMLNGHSRLKTVSGEKELEAFGNDVARLNRLPAIFIIQGKVNITDWLQGLQSPAIILYPEIACSKIRAENLWFMSAGGADETLAPDVLKAVIAVWPDMLTMSRNLMIEYGCDDNQAGFKGSMLLSMFARKLHIEYRDPHLFSKRYVHPEIIPAKLLRIFCNMVERGTFTFADSEWKYKTKDRSTDVGYIAKDKLRIRPKALLSLVTKVMTGITMATLEECFTDKFAMTGKSGRGEFIVDSVAWDNVIKIPSAIRMVTAEELGLRKVG